MALHAHETGPHAAARLRPRSQFDQDGPGVPRLRLAADGMDADAAYQIVHDELLLDGSARLNLATFVTTWMEPAAERLMADCAAKNMIDKDEYPQTAELERRCVNILADLWHAEPGAGATGCSTTGSSEAAMLGGLALKWRWRQRAEATGRRPGRPNLVMGTNVQVCWEKFCRYFDVDARQVPVGPEAHLTPDAAAAACDADTIGVVAIVGSTFDGSFEPVADIAAALDARADADGVDVPVHVDAASGGFVAPFLDPDLVWDFRVPRVQSINASGHKYGLVYPGVGWVLWREADALPGDLVFDVDYLGGHMPTFALNFSRPGAQVAAQYYMFLRLGADGYRAVQAQSRDTARWLAGEVGRLGPYTVHGDGSALPLITFSAAPDAGVDVYDVSERLRGRGWQVPAYPMPPNLADTHVLRVVVRNGFTPDLAGLFLDALRAVTAEAADRPDQRAHPAHPAFHH